MKIKKRYSAFLIFWLVFLLFICQNCSPTKERKDLSNLFWSAEKIDIIGVLDLRSSPYFHSKYYSFSLDNNNQINLELSKPGIYFFRLWKAKDYLSVLENENISLFINDKKIKDIDFYKNEFTDCYIGWPLLKKGRNIIYFNSSHTIISPKKIVNFIEIGFLVNSLVKYLKKEKFKKFARVSSRKWLKSKQGLAQKKNSYLNYYLKVTPGMSLRLGYRLVDFGRNYNYSLPVFSVGITDQDGQFERLFKVTSAEASPQSFSLQPYEGQVVKLTFRFVTARKTPGPNSQVIWMEPALVAPPVVKESAREREIHFPGVSREQRNIFLIVLDALNAHHLSCYGYPFKTTPNIDEVSSEGIRFSQAYTQGVNTNLSLASMFTSLYPETTRVWGYRLQLAEKAETIAEILEKKDMHTVVISDHQGLEMSNLIQGFQEKIIFEGDLLRDRPSFFKKILGYLKDLSPSDAGHFIYMHFLYPHSPYLPPEPYRSKFDKDYKGNIKGTQKMLLDINQGKIRVTERDIRHLRALFDGNLNYIDHILGEIFKVLKLNGLYDNSLIIITSDHGEGLMEHGYLFHNKYVYEESIHVPLILKFPPSYISGPKEILTPVELIDLYPTILDYLGIGYTRRVIHGKSLISLIKNIPGYSKQLIYSRGHSQFFSFSARFGRYKYIYHAPTRCDELYDISQDPEEKNNLVFTYPDLTGYYKMKTLDWIFQQWNTGQSLALPRKYSKKEWERLKALGYFK